MFRRVENTLEPDPTFPADLKQLGFFVNEVGHIRMTEAPEKPYVYHATNNERVNDVRREAMQACQRGESEKRIHALGIERVYLPGLTATKPSGPHVPILSPPLAVLKTRKRIVVVVNDALQDLGILAYRQLQRELGVNGGSVVNFVREMIKRSYVDSTNEQEDETLTDGFEPKNAENAPGLIILNTGQLLYSHKHNRAMTLRSWSAMPRKSVTHDMIRIHEEENRVQGHRNPKEHVKTIFDEILCDPARVASDTEVYVIAIEDGTASVLDVLAGDFEKYGARIAAMALVHSTVDDSQIHNQSLRAFLHQRARHWRYSELTLDPYKCIDLPKDYSQEFDGVPSRDTAAIKKTAKHIRWNEFLPASDPVAATAHALHHLTIAATSPKKEKVSSEASDAVTAWSSGQVVVCPTFAGGEESVAECVFTNPTVQQAILAFFEEVAQDPENYRNPDVKIYTDIPKPTPNNPLELSVDNSTTSSQPLPSEMTPEHAELDEARHNLLEMRIALDACPADIQELAPGRARLAHKIQAKKIEIEHLEKRALATGALRAGEAAEQRENWKPQTEGPKVPFAGSMVDSELLKAAGLFETAKVELEKLGEGDEEKAFI